MIQPRKRQAPCVAQQVLDVGRETSLVNPRVPRADRRVPCIDRQMPRINRQGSCVKGQASRAARQAPAVPPNGPTTQMPQAPVAALLCLALSLTLVAVFASVTDVTLAQTPGETVELTFWSWRTEDVEQYNRIIQVFEERNPGIKVRFIPYLNTEYNTILSTALQGGGGPDIIHLRSYGGAEVLANAGYLMPLDGVVEALEEFPQEVLLGATSRKDGRVYGVPFAYQTVQVLYNQRIFAENGLAIPQTWGEFLELAGTLKERGIIPFANGAKDAWMLEILWGAVGPQFYGGTKFFNEVTTGKTDFLDPRFVESLRRLNELVPYFPPGYMGVGYTDMQMLFAQEVAAMFIGGSFELGIMASLNPDLEIGAFPVPPLEAGDPAYVAAWVDGSYGINASTKHPEAALKFIEFTATQEFGQMFTDELKQISAVPGTVPTDPTLAQLVAALHEASTPYLMLVAFRYDQPTGSTLLQNGIQEMLAGLKTPEEVAQDIQEGLSLWFEPFQSRG